MVVGKTVDKLGAKILCNAGFLADENTPRGKVSSSIFGKAVSSVYCNPDKKLIWGKVGDFAWGLINDSPNTSVGNLVTPFKLDFDKKLISKNDDYGSR